MNAPIVVRFSTSPQLLYRAQAAMMRHIRWMRWGGVFVVGIFPLFMIGIQLAYGQPLSSAVRNNLAWIIGFPIFWLIGIPLLQRWGAAQTFRTMPAARGDRVFTFGESGIVIDGGLSSGTIAWPAVVRSCCRPSLVRVLGIPILSGSRVQQVRGCRYLYGPRLELDPAGGLMPEFVAGCMPVDVPRAAAARLFNRREYAMRSIVIGLMVMSLAAARLPAQIPVFPILAAGDVGRLARLTDIGLHSRTGRIAGVTVDSLFLSPSDSTAPDAIAYGDITRLSIYEPLSPATLRRRRLIGVTSGIAVGATIGIELSGPQVRGSLGVPYAQAYSYLDALLGAGLGAGVGYALASIQKSHWVTRFEKR